MQSFCSTQECWAAKRKLAAAILKNSSICASSLVCPADILWKSCAICYEGGEAVKDLTPTEAEKKLHSKQADKNAELVEIIIEVTKRVLEQ